MKLKDIVVLANAGFNAQEIAKLSKMAKPEQAVEKQQSEDSMDVLKTLLQMNNIQTAEQPAQQETVDDILASIINPPEKNNNGGNQK